MSAATSVKAFGFSLRKRRYLRAFLPEHRVAFVDDVDAIRAGDTVAIWASSNQALALAARTDVRVLQIEDGFLRSVGLGAALAPPLSWIIDARGIHFDPSRPSDIEHLLQTTAFSPALLNRARDLRKRLVDSRISKYNLGTEDWHGLSTRRRSAQRAVLVTGQVETDASIRAGTRTVDSNIALLEAARSMHPRDWLVYKPHPDVTAGLRRAGVREEHALELCDEIVTAAPITALIDAVDVVHVMTSLAGFEAVLRHKEVHCHGLPFYAGWGLTTDALRCERRTRRLQTDELVAAALILYPRYVDARSGQRCSAEAAVEQLIAWKARDDGTLRWWQQLLKPVLRHE